jgi:hypothetical protein
MMASRVPLKQLKVLDLLSIFADIISELCDRGVLRTVNNPAADYAEFLVSAALGLQSAPKSAKGYDAIDKRGRKYEIKARRITRMSRPTRFSAIRKLEERHFDFLVGVLFDEHFNVKHAKVLPRASVQKKAFWQANVNGWILPICDELWEGKTGVDITSRLRRVQRTSAA